MRAGSNTDGELPPLFVNDLKNAGPVTVKLPVSTGVVPTCSFAKGAVVPIPTLPPVS